MLTEQQELESLQSKAKKERTSSKPSLTKYQIESTPFWIIGTEEKGYAICIGNYRLTELKKTEEEAEKCLSDEQWIIIGNLIAVVVQEQIKQQSQAK